MDFKNKIVTLGGVDRIINSAINKNDEILRNQNLIDYKVQNIPEDLRSFLLEFAPFQFNKNVGIKNSNIGLKDLIKENILSVDIFYSLNINSKYNIYLELFDTQGQIPEDLVPFCDGYSGDYFCVGIEEHNFGKIYYFWHEAPNNKLFKVCETFQTFFDSLINFEISEIDETDIETTFIKKEYEQQILEWKRKNGLI